MDENKEIRDVGFLPNYSDYEGGRAVVRQVRYVKARFAEILSKSDPHGEIAVEFTNDEVIVVKVRGQPGHWEMQITSDDDMYRFERGDAVLMFALEPTKEES